MIGFITEKKSNENNLTSELIELILKLRTNAKKNKDFDTADIIREELNKSGIQIKDSREGTKWERK